MSKLYGTIDGAGKTQATRRGHSTLTTHAAGWKGAIRVDVVAGEDSDTFTVSLVPWQNSGGHNVELAHGVLDANGEPHGTMRVVKRPKTTKLPKATKTKYSAADALESRADVNGCLRLGTSRR